MLPHIAKTPKLALDCNCLAIRFSTNYPYRQSKGIVIMHRTLRAVKFLVTGPIILAVLVVINLMTTPGNWWFKWAALGIGIAWIVSLARVIRAMVLLGGLLALIAYIKNKNDEAAIPPS